MDDADPELGALILDAARAQLDARVDALQTLGPGPNPPIDGWSAAPLTEGVLRSIGAASGVIVREVLRDTTAACGLPAPELALRLGGVHPDTVVAVARTVDRQLAGRMSAWSAFSAAVRVGVRAQGVWDLAAVWRLACDADPAWLRSFGTTLVASLGDAADRQVERGVVGWAAVLARGDTGGEPWTDRRQSVADRLRGRRPRGILHLEATFDRRLQLTDGTLLGLDEPSVGALRRSTEPAAALGLPVSLTVTSQEESGTSLQIGRDEAGVLSVHCAGRGAAFLQRVGDGFGQEVGAVWVLDELLAVPLSRLPIALGR